jgi:predicted GNAT family N-acyltransferase
MRSLLDKADAERYPSVVLSAQTHALHFYAQLGFVPYGQRFMVRSIEHQMMSRRLPE